MTKYKNVPHSNKLVDHISPETLAKLVRLRQQLVNG